MSQQSLVIIGSGIAGISCAKELCELQCSSVYKKNKKKKYKVILVTASKNATVINNTAKLTNHLELFDVKELSLTSIIEEYPCIEIKKANLMNIDPIKQLLFFEDKSLLHYDSVCICSGAKPNIPFNHPLIIGIRDTDTVKTLLSKISIAKKVAIIGNGGIAMELVEAIDFCDILWIMKHQTIGHSFFDKYTSEFFMSKIKKINRNANNNVIGKKDQNEENCMIFSNKKIKNNPIISNGSAIGPEWFHSIFNSNKKVKKSNHSSNLVLCQNSEVIAIYVQDDVANKRWKNIVNNNINEAFIPTNHFNENDSWPIYIKTSTDNNLFGCDFVICGTGVYSNTDFITKETNIIKTDNNEIIVNEKLQTVHYSNIYAAGDCSFPNIKKDLNELDTDFLSLWIPMKLWTQAKAMGIYAGRIMSSLCDEITAGNPFEMFAHATSFFRYKVLLLGLFNGQGLEKYDKNITKMIIKKDIKKDFNYTIETFIPNENNKNNNINEKVIIWIRIHSNIDYAKLVIFQKRVIGAVLIGETSLEETIENIILNKINIEPYGIQVLDPTFDLEDYFD